MKILFFGGAMLVLLLCLVAVLGVIWYDLEGKREGQAALVQGQEHGAENKIKRCMPAALQRTEKAGKGDRFMLRFFPDKAPDAIFLRACLEASTPSKGFCREVPPLSDSRMAAAWRSDTCSRTTADGNACQELFKVLQEFCAR